MLFYLPGLEAAEAARVRSGPAPQKDNRMHFTPEDEGNFKHTADPLNHPGHLAVKAEAPAGALTHRLLKEVKRMGGWLSLKSSASRPDPKRAVSIPTKSLNSRRRAGMPGRESWGPLRVWGRGPSTRGPTGRRGAPSAPGPEASSWAKEGKCSRWLLRPLLNLKSLGRCKIESPGSSPAGPLPPPLPGDSAPPTCTVAPTAGPGRGQVRPRGGWTRALKGKWPHAGAGAHLPSPRVSRLRFSGAQAHGETLEPGLCGLHRVSPSLCLSLQ